jgi:hypothetical protein
MKQTSAMKRELVLANKQLNKQNVTSRSEELDIVPGYAKRLEKAT